MRLHNEIIKRLHNWFKRYYYLSDITLSKRFIKGKKKKTVLHKKYSRSLSSNHVSRSTSWTISRSCYRLNICHQVLHHLFFHVIQSSPSLILIYLSVSCEANPLQMGTIHHFFWNLWFFSETWWYWWDTSVTKWRSIQGSIEFYWSCWNPPFFKDILNDLMIEWSKCIDYCLYIWISWNHESSLRCRSRSELFWWGFLTWYCLPL